MTSLALALTLTAKRVGFPQPEFSGKIRLRPQPLYHHGRWLPKPTLQNFPDIFLPKPTLQNFRDIYKEIIILLLTPTGKNLLSSSWYCAAFIPLTSLLNLFGSY